MKIPHSTQNMRHQSRASLVKSGWGCLDRHPQLPPLSHIQHLSAPHHVFFTPGHSPGLGNIPRASLSHSGELHRLWVPTEWFQSGGDWGSLAAASVTSVTGQLGRHSLCSPLELPQIQPRCGAHTLLQIPGFLSLLNVNGILWFLPRKKCGVIGGQCLAFWHPWTLSSNMYKYLIMRKPLRSPHRGCSRKTWRS